jgi:hypothetical protein
MGLSMPFGFGRLLSTRLMTVSCHAQLSGTLDRSEGADRSRKVRGLECSAYAMSHEQYAARPIDGGGTGSQLRSEVGLKLVNRDLYQKRLRSELVDDDQQDHRGANHSVKWMRKTKHKYGSRNAALHIT